MDSVMTTKDEALEIAERFLQMENEIRALRIVLNRSWTHETTAEDFVQKGLNQLLSHETYHQRYSELESAIRAASDDDSLIHTLHQEMLRRTKVD